MADAKKTDRAPWDAKRFQAYQDDEDMEGLILELVEHFEATDTGEITKELIDRRFGKEIKKYKDQICTKIFVMMNQGKLEVTHNLRIKLSKSKSPKQG